MLRLSGRIKYILFVLLLAQLVLSCRPARYVPQDKFLLRKTKIRSDDSRIPSRRLNELPRQLPNQHFFGLLRFHLWVHNISKCDNPGKFRRWFLETIGEPPVIYDQDYSERSRQNIEQFMRNKGFFNARVTTEEKKRRKRITVTYRINAGQQFYVKDITTDIPFEGYASVYNQNIKNIAIGKGTLFDMDDLTAEKERITIEMKRNGYYFFDNDAISFVADTSVSQGGVSLHMSIKVPTKDSIAAVKAQRRYRVGRTWFVANYNNSEVLKDKQSFFNSLDTIEIKENICVLSKEKPHVKANVFQNCNFIRNGELYNISEVDKTKLLLSQNRIFKQITIDFKERGTIGDEGLLDCYILVSPNLKQSYSIDLEGTNTGGDLGAQVNLTYENKNVTRGAEIFNIRFRNSYEQNSVLSKEDERKNFNSHELGVDASLEFPKFLFPFWNTSFSKNYRLRTFVKGGYSFQKIPYYERPLRYLSFGYISRGQNYLTHFFTPFEINGVQYLSKSTTFQRFIDQRYYYKYSYEDYYISSSSYTVIFNNKTGSSTKDYLFVKFNSEIAGNVLNLYCNVTGYDNSEGFYRIFDTRFAQYFKNDIDVRYYLVQGVSTMQAFRLYLGAALPYGNSEVLPNIKKYYSGGSNSMRAWGVRSLGPGSYSPPDTSGVVYAMGDLKVEANAEQRFPIAGLLNGALFVDAGNIWTIKETDAGSQISSHALGDIAIACGFGLRLDFSFFVLRFDSGVKTRNPANTTSEKWIWEKKIDLKKDINYSIGIGYPF